MKKQTLATTGAIGASLLIASCCVAPTLFLLFGVSVGALGVLTSLEPYRPIFIGLGGLALLYAGWRAWRPEPTGSGETCDDEICDSDSPQRRRRRRLVSVAVVLYGLAIAYPYALEALL